MMTILLPIPTPKQEYEAYFIPHDIKDGFINKSLKVTMRGNETVRAFRENIE